MEGHNKNRQMTTKDDHHQIELTEITPINKKTNELREMMSKNTDSSIDKIMTKDVDVQTEITANIFDDYESVIANTY